MEAHGSMGCNPEGSSGHWEGGVAHDQDMETIQFCLRDGNANVVCKAIWPATQWDLMEIMVSLCCGSQTLRIPRDSPGRHTDGRCRVEFVRQSGPQHNETL